MGRRQASAASRREREQARVSKRHTVDGLDLRDDLARLCGLPFVRQHFPVPALAAGEDDRRMVEHEDLDHRTFQAARLARTPGLV